MADLLDFAPVRVFTSNAAPGAGYIARFYQSGTTTPVTVYSDLALNTAWGSSVTADAEGVFPAVFSAGGAIKATIETPDGAVVATIDPVQSVASGAAAAETVTFTPTVDLPFTNVQDAIEGAAASAASGFTPFGLGVTGSVELLADLDATNIATGQYRFDGTTTGTFPTGVAAADTGAVEVVRETSGSAWMRLYHDTTDRLFTRRMNASTWGAWREEITANIGATEGDIIYRTSTAWTRLAKGTASQILAMNSGATAPEWITNPTPIKAWVNFNGIPQAGTYSRSGNTVTVTMTGHGMSTGMVANLDFTSGSATDGSYAVTVTGVDTFTIQDPASGTTSGNVTLNNYIRSSFNVTSVTDSGTGRYTVNITSAISDARYAALATAGDAVENRLAAQTADMTTTTFKIYVINHGNGVFSDAQFVSATVIR